MLIAVLAAAGLSGCTGSDPKPGAGDSTSDDSGAEVSAEPGRYNTLPEACGAVSPKTLHRLLPGGTDAEKAYEGQATVTYDIDRRDGCRWKVATPSGTRYLTLDFERVVSYDPSVSDDDRAQELYEKKAVAADIPDAPPSSSPGASDEEEDEPSDDPSSSSSPGSGASGSSDSSGASASSGQGGASPESSESGAGSEKGNTGEKGGTGTPSAGDDEGTASDGDTPENPDATAPRRLDDLADDAFLNDQLITKDSGIHRDITVVFRSSNVIATIEYDEWSTNKKDIPESEELQGNAEDLAQELTGRLTE
ncbi:DUF3558 domain-containing protein [Streptomyces botrytidirepellens]|uniref:DUF3558 domain-containing protein n=1 Tax=Streptomyces botrytidirepellens TaxID=2486417 RepID=A0A3M8VMQ8_9ACTN|nr:DUF3558 domain-containing protein [Streptomyces botrytidirepellens]